MRSLQADIQTLIQLIDFILYRQPSQAELQTVKAQFQEVAERLKYNAQRTGHIENINKPLARVLTNAATGR